MCLCLCMCASVCLTMCVCLGIGVMRFYCFSEEKKKQKKEPAPGPTLKSPGKVLFLILICSPKLIYCYYTVAFFFCFSVNAYPFLHIPFLKIVRTEFEIFFLLLNPLQGLKHTKETAIKTIRRPSLRLEFEWS